jgi:hypothetical protein
MGRMTDVPEIDGVRCNCHPETCSHFGGYRVQPREVSRVENIQVEEVKVIEKPKYIPKSPFRVGRKRKRAVLDFNGVEVTLFREGAEDLAQQFCDWINNLK